MHVNLPMVGLCLYTTWISLHPFVSENTPLYPPLSPHHQPCVTPLFHLLSISLSIIYKTLLIRLSPLLHPPFPLTTITAAAAMDPNLPPSEGTDSNYSSESLLTPLHEVIMPTSNMQNSTLRAFPECLPLPPPLLSLPPPPPPPLSTIGNTYMQSLMGNYQQPVYPPTQDLVPNTGNPNYSFMALLEGDERAVRQAELELVESMYSPPLNSTNPSFAPASPLFPVSSLPLPTVYTNQSMAHHLGEATASPQLGNQLSSSMDMIRSLNNQYYNNSFNSFPFPDSTNLLNSTSSSIIVHTTMNQPLSYPVQGSQEKNAAFTCRTCRVHFPTAQAYGGHMSSHSKTRKVPNVVPQTLFKKPRATLHFPFFSYGRGKGVAINPSKNFDASKVAKNTTGGDVNSSQASKGKEPMSSQGDLAKENDDESERETQSPKKKA